MRDIITVMKFTMLEMVKKKSFIISTIIIALFIIVGLNVPNILKSFDSEVENSKILIVDKDNIFEGNLSNGFLEQYGYDVVIKDASLEEVRTEVNDEKVDSAIIITKEEAGIGLKYVVKNAFMDSGMDEYLANALTAMYQNIQLVKMGITETQFQSLNPNFIYSVETTEEASGNIFVIMMLSILLFYAIYFCAFQVSSSITTEKTSKIIETLVTSTAPRNIVIGKTFGIGLVGLLQIIFYLIIAFITAHFCISKEMLDMVLDTSNLTIGLVLITLIYFVLGYFTFAFLYALTGSTVSKPEDIQSANSPVALITIVGFYLAYFTMMNPTGNMNHIAALVPISSPFCMPLRIMMGVTNPGEIILSIFILVVTCLLIAFITIKIYTNAIINYGTKFSFKNLIKLYKQK